MYDICLRMYVRTFVCMYVQKSNKYCRHMVGIHVFPCQSAFAKSQQCFALKNLQFPASIIFWFNLRSFLPPAFRSSFGKMNLDGVGLVLEGNARQLGLLKDQLVGRLVFRIFGSVFLFHCTKAFVEISQLTWLECNC